MNLVAIISIISNFFFSTLNAASPSPVFWSEVNSPRDSWAQAERHTDLPQRKSDAELLTITAKSAVLYDIKSGFFLFEKNAQDIRPTASITKLMTALVFLDNNPDWNKEYTIKREEVDGSNNANIFSGDTLTIKDLFYLSLVNSDNTATSALVSASGLKREDFVNEMNNKAKKLGLTHTSFTDPIGLSDQNVSTAYEIARLAQEAFSKTEIQQAVVSKKYRFKTGEGDVRVVSSTDELLSQNISGLKILGGKTGYTDPAGACFVGRFSNAEGREIISVILGSATKDERFSDTKALVQWFYNNFIW
ncbi:MAG: serine hydrolase [Planctomycetes bacterium]|jgi:D-alanyl-D-alanine carboxypeptidase|nr:serine hydrolase [Planctomycetota bacterium]